jgi:uncharacterized membrane protein YjfL (UPF0719 family)
MKKEIKEEFCGSCLSLVPAALGVGGVAVASSAKKSRKWKKALFWGSLVITILSIILFIWFKTRPCSTCR